MNKLLLILSLPVLLISACNKKAETFTKVGFYFEDKNASGDMFYDLYIDDQYEGKLPVYSEEPQDASMFYFRVLDNRRHDIDVRKNGAYLSATYLQITERKTCSGTNRQKSQLVSGINASRYTSNNSRDYAVYAMFN